MQEYIFIVGKADPFDASIEAIRRAGYKVGVFQDTTIPPLEGSRFDSVVPIDFSQLSQLDRGDFGNLPIAGLLTSYENYIPAKALIGSLLGLPAPSAAAARNCTDKLLMRQAFAAHDASLSPAFQMIASVEDALAFAREHGYPVIIKPANLVKSLLVSRCDNEEQLAAAVRQALSEVATLYKKYKIYAYEPKLIIEEFMEGDLYSVAGFVEKDGQVYICPGVTELTSAQQAGYDDNFLYRRLLPAPVSDSLQERLFTAGREGIRALGLRSSAAHIELMHTRNDEVKIIEIGARIGGYRPRIYGLAYEARLLDLEIAVATGQPVPTIPENLHGQTAVYELFPRQAGRFDCIVPETVVADLRATAYSFDIKVIQGEACGPAKDGYKAVAVIIVHSADSQQFAAACAAVDNLEVRVL